jgi:hypothetical protein
MATFGLGWGFHDLHARGVKDSVDLAHALFPEPRAFIAWPEKELRPLRELRDLCRQLPGIAQEERTHAGYVRAKHQRDSDRGLKRAPL